MIIDSKMNYHSLEDEELGGSADLKRSQSGSLEKDLV